MERKYVLLAIITLKSVRRNMFNNSIANRNAYLKTFSGAKVRHLDNLLNQHCPRISQKWLYYTSVLIK